MPSRPTNIDPIMATQLKLVKDHFKLSQEEMAELCGVSQGMISLMMNGKRDIPAFVIKNLFVRKSISPVFMYTNEGNMEYRKKNNSSEISLKDLHAEVEILKGQIAKLMTK